MVYCMCNTNTVDKAVHAAFDLGKDGSTSAVSSGSSSSSAGQSTQEQQQEQRQRYESVDVSVALKKLWSARLRKMVLETGTRSDGRKTDEVRPITIETSVLPRTHGSALFTRGDTQALATVTLGGSALPAFAVTVPTHFKPIHQLTSLYTALNASSHTQHTQTCMHSSMQQKSDSIDGSVTKKFYLQYTFPPSCVGEVGRVGAPGRREGWPVTAVNDLSMTQVGHGNLAERALVAVLPTDEAFPYSIRVESLITESCGSSSMASVCGGCMAMMDAGVPIKSPIAGVAMGLLLDE
eukprot:14527-Heterococcus_DN1.PRE.1